MFNHIRSRNRTAVVFLISVAVFVPALVVPRSGEDLAVRKMILFASLALVLISGVWLFVRWSDAKRLVRLRAGEGILARWTIDAARWEWFRGLSSGWDLQKNLRPNDADLAQQPGDAGLEIVVTLDGILIGEDFQPLERDVRITVRPDWMEFYQIIPKPKGPPLHTVVRVPLQSGKEGLATEVQQAYQRRTGAPGVGRLQILYVGLFCLVGVPAIAALTFFIAKATGWVQ